MIIPDELMEQLVLAERAIEEAILRGEYPLGRSKFGIISVEGNAYHFIGPWVCAIGAYLVGKKPIGDTPTESAAISLNVPQAWVWGVQYGFDGANEYSGPSLLIAHGIGVGHQLAQQYLQQNPEE